MSNKQATEMAARSSKQREKIKRVYLPNGTFRYVGLKEFQVYVAKNPNSETAERARTRKDPDYPKPKDIKMVVYQRAADRLHGKRPAPIDTRDKLSPTDLGTADRAERLRRRGFTPASEPTGTLRFSPKVKDKKKDKKKEK